MATAPKPVPKAVPKAEAAEGGGKSPPKSNKLLIIILSATVLLLGGAGAGGWFWWQQQTGGDKTRKAAPPAPPVFAAMEPFTVNLQSEPGSEQFLQVALTLQVGDTSDVDAIKLYMPQVRSRVLLLLSSKTASEIATVDGKKKLAAEIMSQIKQPFAANAQALKVNDVFFTSFVIQ